MAAEVGGNSLSPISMEALNYVEDFQSSLSHLSSCSPAGICGRQFAGPWLIESAGRRDNLQSPPFDWWGCSQAGMRGFPESAAQ